MARKGGNPHRVHAAASLTVPRRRAARVRESVLSFGWARAMATSRHCATRGVVLILAVVTPVVTLAPAQAQEIKSGGCSGSRYAFNCVTIWAPAGDPFIRQVPGPVGAAAIARARQRERHWVDRCRPVIAPDRYGVARYHYAAPGCEFGVGDY